MQKRSILIVDDVEVNRLILCDIFEGEYQTIQASNGLEAMQILDSGADISAILLDLMMPVMDGFTFLREIRKDKRYANIPVLVNTQRDQNELETLQLGADDYIMKPYNAEIIKRRVSNIITKYVLQRERLESQLSDTKKELNSIVNTVPGGILTLRMGKKITIEYHNQGILKLLGYGPKDPIREEFDDASRYIKGEMRNTVLEETADDIAARRPIHISFPITTVSGEDIWLDMQGAFFKEEEGVPLYHCVLIDITESVALREELEYRAARDIATGVYNADTFYEIAHQFIRVSEPGEYEITYWNIERFKGINDLFGIDVGDRIIRSMAMFLQKEFRTYGFVGRLSADNFAVLSRKGKYDYHDIIQRIQEELKKTKIYYDLIVTCGLYEVTDPTLPTAIMVDRARMASKENPDYVRNPVSQFKEPLRESYLLEQELIGEMEHALKNQEFFVLLQPIFDTITRQPVSAEALIRWKSSNKGTISPSVFIPLFEKNGFVTNLDYFVLEEVCKLQADMLAKEETVVPISVNLSRKDFYDDDITERIQSVLKKYGLETWMIKLEVTESAYTENSEQLLSSIRRLRHCGFEVLMDDFGSAYSSLNMLKDVEIDILKIDMKFVDQLERSHRGANIIMSVNNMAKMLNMIVVAEGVETQYQYEFMRGIGCDRIQGYYFSKPLSMEEFRALVNKEARENIIVPAVRSNQKTILLVEDSAFIRTALRMTLEEKYNIVEAKNGKEAIDFILSGTNRVDLMITDIMMPVMDGMQLLEKLQTEMEWFKVPIIVSSDISDMDYIERALSMGAVDYLPKPVNHMILMHKVSNIMRLSDIEHLNNELSLLHNMQEKDLITFVLNRISFQQKVNEIASYLEEMEEKAVYILFDLDSFKQVNTRYGEDYGNDVLRRFCNILKNRFGDDAIIGRVGGDEFGVFLRPPVTESHLKDWINELIDDITLPLLPGKSDEIQTCSIGVAIAPDLGMDFNLLTRAAGNAIYETRLKEGPGAIVWCDAKKQ